MYRRMSGIRWVDKNEASYRRARYKKYSSDTIDIEMSRLDAQPGRYFKL